MALVLNTDTHKKTRRIYLPVWLLVLACIVYGVIVVFIKQDIDLTYDRLVKVKQPLVAYEIDDEDYLYLTDLRVLRAGETMGLISVERPLPESFTPTELVNTKLPHGDKSQAMKLSAKISKPLNDLFAAAEQAGYPLMISSAYRSITDQKKLLTDYKIKYGAAMAAEFVAPPGSSEHHSGLAIDLSDSSSECEIDSDSCGLSLATAAWLYDNAYKFGFIQRYPEGKQEITNVAHEPWHYRYVGVVLARHIHESGLTLDEVIQKIQPGIFKE